jgi:hypothetical protein
MTTKTRVLFFIIFQTFFLWFLAIVSSNSLNAQSIEASPASTPPIQPVDTPLDLLQGTKPEILMSVDQMESIPVSEPNTQDINNTGNSTRGKQERNGAYNKASVNKSSNKANSEFSNISFKPKYIPTALLDKWNQILKDAGINGAQNIVILNNAISLDFNNYTSPDIQNRFQELIRNFKVEEKDAILYLLPQLINEKRLKLDDEDIENSIKLFFAYQPELFCFVPVSLFEKLKTPKGLNSIVELQKSKSVIE